LTIRTKEDLEAKPGSGETVQAASPSGDSKTAAKSKDEIQGVFVLRDKKVEFVPVETGVAGTTDIEISKGIKDGDEIVTGSYKVLRTIKPGTGVKVDNTAPKKDEETT
jgi:HlyD family secretion protein